MSKLLNTEIPRRTVLKGGLVLAAQFLAGCSFATTKGQAGELVGFTPVPFAAGKSLLPVIADEYEYEVLIPWGTPLQPDGPAYSYPPSSQQQQQQMGIGHDGMAYFPLSNDGYRGLLAINHEYGTNKHVLGVDVPTSLEQVRASQHAVGASIVEITRTDSGWQRVKSHYARRIHPNSPVTFSGPVAGSGFIKNAANNPYLGTFANCSNGRTPWGTYLTCEENFNLYFAASTGIPLTEAQRRYGLNQHGAGYHWHKFDPRFDLANGQYANEQNRFGWVVEIDPMQPNKPPVKRTALGRMKHEGAAHGVSKDGRIVIYMGDDQRFEHIYKFVSADNWKIMRAEGRSPLDEGTLFVARFDAGGKGVWLPLTMDNPALKARFKDQADILVHARLAATAVGATDMDRPEWTSVGPDGSVFCSLTNNTKRKTPNAANPQAPNPHGHILRWQEDGDPTNSTFSWEIFLMSSDGFEDENSYSSPDGLWADPDGRLFIETDGDQREDHNNQLLVADINTGEVKRLLYGVPGCEITGITTTPDRRTLFVNFQHPGKGSPELTNFPAQPDQKTIPRDATLAIRRKDGGIVGS